MMDKTMTVLLAILASILMTSRGDLAAIKCVTGALGETSAIWERKMKTYFNRFDFDGDGVIMQNQHSKVAERFADSENANPEQKEDLMENFQQLWPLLTKCALLNNGYLTPSILIESLQTQLEDPELKATYTRLTMSLLNILQVSNVGYVDVEEWRRFFSDLGVNDTTWVPEAFEQMDVNQEGKLSFEEIVNAFFDFLLLQDEDSPNAEFFGPLVDA